MDRQQALQKLYFDSETERERARASETRHVREKNERVSALAKETGGGGRGTNWTT